MFTIQLTHKSNSVLRCIAECFQNHQIHSDLDEKDISCMNLFCLYLEMSDSGL